MEIEADSIHKFNPGDVVSNNAFGEGKVVVQHGDKVEVAFDAGVRKIMESSLVFVRKGDPKDIPAAAKAKKRPKPRVEKHPPEDGKEYLLAKIAKSKELNAAIGTAFEDLTQFVIGIAGTSWYSRKETGSLYPRLVSHKTGNHRVCFWISCETKIPHDIHIRIGVFADMFPEKCTDLFKLVPKHWIKDCYLTEIREPQLPNIELYKQVIRDLIHYAEKGQIGSKS